MSAAPCTLGIITTSSADPASRTAVVRSSNPQGESSEFTRVHSCVPGVDQAFATSTRPARAASFSLEGTPSSRLASRTSTVGAISGTLATSLALDGGKKWIIRDGRAGISRGGAGAPTARAAKKSLGLRMVLSVGVAPARPPARSRDADHTRDAGAASPPLSTIVDSAPERSRPGSAVGGRLGQDGVQHRLVESPGEGVLLAHVIATHQPDPAGRAGPLQQDLGAMAELRPGNRYRPALPAGSGQGS